MIKECYEKICAGTEVRANLISLREELKDEKSRRELAYLLNGDFSQLCGLLGHEDPKVRKNAALILGELESEDLLPVLFGAYEREKTLFIRADYLKAMSHLDYRPLAGKLEAMLSGLRSTDVSEEEWKHRSAEIRMLQAMVLRCRGVRRHRFSGMREKPEVILLTNRCQREATASQIRGWGSARGTRSGDASAGNGYKITMLAGGVRVQGAPLKVLLPIRTYSELLFPLETQRLPIDQPAVCGKLLAEPVLALVRRLYSGDGAFLFRTELRGKLNTEKKGIYVRRLSDALESASGGELINSVSDYEAEVRLIPKKDGTFAAVLKLTAIADSRFAYRTEVTAASIAPVNAALTVRLAMPWLKENAQVLDPFCGVGTMLIERSLAVKAGTMYGIDIFGEAIEKARRNSERAGCRINYINRDFFSFSHEYLFDEVITDMPQVTAGVPRQEIHRLYLDFFAFVGSLLQEQAVLVLYATEPDYVKEAVQAAAGYRICERFLINEKNGTSVFIIRWNKK